MAEQTKQTKPRTPTVCIWCEQWITDDPAPAPCWITEDGDTGCDNSPVTSDDGVGGHMSLADVREAVRRDELVFPDLLAMLDGALHWCKQDADNEDGYATQEMLDNRVDELHDAIALAQGGSQ